jgi:mRNA interferase MazF
MTKVTVAPITTTINGLSSDVLVGPANGLATDPLPRSGAGMSVPRKSVPRARGLEARTEGRPRQAQADGP